MRYRQLFLSASHEHYHTFLLYVYLLDDVRVNMPTFAPINVRSYLLCKDWFSLFCRVQVQLSVGRQHFKFSLRSFLDSRPGDYGPSNNELYYLRGWLCCSFYRHVDDHHVIYSSLRLSIVIANRSQLTHGQNALSDLCAKNRTSFVGQCAEMAQKYDMISMPSRTEDEQGNVDEVIKRDGNMQILSRCC